MDDHEGQGPAADAIAEHARVASAGGAQSEQYSALKEALSGASPDQRSAATKQLVDERDAYEILHTALQELGIEPSQE